MDYSEDPEPYNRQADEWQRGYEKQKVRIKELERLAYIGEHHHADLTWKARCEETQRQLDEARALVEAASAAIAHATRYLPHAVSDSGFLSPLVRALAKEDGK